MANYIHRYYPEITCETIEPTRSGWKVLQKDNPKKKPKVAFYPQIYFSPDKGVWIKA